MTARRRPVVLLLAAVALAAPALVGCGPPPTAPRPLATPPPPEPSNAHAYVSPQPSAGIGKDCRDSLRPHGSLPPPGAMPPGMAEIQRRGRLRVAVGSSGNLLSYRDPTTGKMTGFEVDLARQIARAIFGAPDRITFRALNAEDRSAAIKDKTVDMVLAAVTITCEREKRDNGEFSAEYYTAHQRLLVPSNSTVRSLDDLGGQRVCASNKSTNIARIASWPTQPRPVPYAASNTADCMVMLQQHRVAAIATDDLILAGLLAQDPTTKMLIGPDDPVEPTGIEMNRDSTDLIRFVNGVLERVRSDGTWAKLQQKWLAGYIKRASPPEPFYRD